MVTTHYVDAGARPVSGLYVARCGARVPGEAFSATPTCDACRASLDDEQASLIALSQAPQESFGGPPVKTPAFNATAGYTPRGRKIGKGRR